MKYFMCYIYNARIVYLCVKIYVCLRMCAYVEVPTVLKIPKIESLSYTSTSNLDPRTEVRW